MDSLAKILEDSLSPELQWHPIFSMDELYVAIMWSDITRSMHPLATDLLIGKN
ncbi:hypothetical protein [Saccharicrinis aurantiacus]|uniref:hypothetical protein n=1 Tax=Saccharicrinis aurantiacus TaxID=1849719 RepID=UPI0015C538B0|nr:hypothetical protein [Saccharicrinis aurantiacus]